jgi:urease accessory protein
VPESAPLPLILTRRSPQPLAQPPAQSLAPPLTLALSADERSRLRGQRRSLCGQELLLQLERGEPLQPGEWLSGASGGPAVQVIAAPETLLRVRAQAPLELLQAAYHLGNRHVALELRATELRLLDDPVLADLLGRRGLLVDRLQEPFCPEAGAYGSAHSHGSVPSHGSVQSHGSAQSHG